MGGHHKSEEYLQEKNILQRYFFPKNKILGVLKKIFWNLGGVTIDVEIFRGVWIWLIKIRGVSICFRIEGCEIGKAPPKRVYGTIPKSWAQRVGGIIISTGVPVTILLHIVVYSVVTISDY